MSCNPNVCRLCLSDKELMWVFEDGVQETHNLPEVILVMTGVEILQRDIISQKICGNCRKVTIKMFEFRERSVKTDQYLKEQCAEYLKNVPMKIPNTEVVIKSGKNTKECSEIPNNDTVPEPKQNKIESRNSITMKRMRKVHPTVTDIFTLYPNIKVPTNVLPYDINPSVCMEMDAVEDYYAHHKLDMNVAAQQAIIPTNTPSTANNQNETVLTKPSTESANQSVVPSTSHTFEEARKVSPISIKFGDKSMFKIVAKDNNSKDEYRDEDESDDMIKSKTSRIKRRRISSSDFSDSEPPVPTLMETLQLKPKENVNVHKCNVCNSVHKSLRDLKKHVQEHFRCNFCRSKFRLVERKESHEDRCVARHALTSEAYVHLYRIDACKSAKLKYPFLVPKTEIDNESTKVSKITEAVKKKVAKNKTIEVSANEIEIIELSDDEDVTTVQVDKPVTGTETNTSSEPTPSKSCSETQTNPINDTSTESLPKLIPISEQPVQYCSTAIVKPDIKIKDNFVLNSVDVWENGNKALKQLITQTALVDCKISVDGDAQTEAPSNDNIIIHPNTSTAELKGLLPQLYVFKVPVDIQKGEFDVKYAKNAEPKSKNMHLWNDLQVIDVKSKNGTWHTAMLNKNKNQVIALLKPVTKDQSGSTLKRAVTRAPIIKTVPASKRSPNSSSSVIIKNGQTPVNNVSRTHQTIQNIKQSVSMHPTENRSTNSVPIILNQTIAHSSLYTPYNSSSNLQNSVFVQPTMTLVPNNNVQLVSNTGSNGLIVNRTSQNQAYLPQSILHTNVVQNFSNQTSPSTTSSTLMVSNPSFTYTNSHQKQKQNVSVTYTTTNPTLSYNNKSSPSVNNIVSTALPSFTNTNPIILNKTPNAAVTYTNIVLQNNSIQSFSAIASPTVTKSVPQDIPITPSSSLLQPNQNVNIALNFVTGNSSQIENKDSVPSAVVLSSCKTLSGATPTLNINPFSEQGALSSDRTQNSVSATVTTASISHFNIVSTSSLGQSAVASTSGINDAISSAARPMIRVKNLCELK